MKDIYNKNRHEELNQRRYHTGLIVENYMREPYHILRLHKAYTLLKQCLRENFKTTINKDINILEIAGSTGHMSQILSKKGFNVLLTDIEKLPLEKATIHTPQLHTRIMDASDSFPFDDNSFHVIYAGDIIEHLFDTVLFLNECYRCLKPNGILLLTTPNLAALEDRIGFLFGKSPRQINPAHKFLQLHIRPFTYEQLKKIMLDIGFTHFRLTTNLIRIKIGNFKKDFFKLASIYPTLGRSLIVAASAAKK